VLDLEITGMYNPHHSEGVSAQSPDREGCIWWKHPQEDSAEVVWIIAEEIHGKVDRHGIARYSIG